MSFLVMYGQEERIIGTSIDNGTAPNDNVEETTFFTYLKELNDAGGGTLYINTEIHIKDISNADTSLLSTKTKEIGDTTPESTYSFYTLEIPSNITLIFTGEGKLLLDQEYFWGNVSDTDNIQHSVRKYNRININGTLNAGINKIFDGDGSKLLKCPTCQLKKVYPQWFGALSNDNVSDSDAIANAITFTESNNGGGTIMFPEGTYLIDEPIKLKSEIILKGIKPENGWNRLTDDNYNFGSHIKVIDGKECSAIEISGGVDNWGLVDLIIDGNEDNQTTSGHHCIKVLSEHTDSNAGATAFGGIINGCKLVNPVEFALYSITGKTMEITETTFISGLFLSGGADINLTACSIEGTHGKHPALFLNHLNSCNFSNNLIWGAGESILSTDSYSDFRYKEKQISLIIDSDKSITFNDLVSSDQGDFSTTNELNLYEGMPVTITPTNPNAKPVFEIMGSSGGVEYTAMNTLFLHETTVGSNIWELWDRPFGTKAAHQVLLEDDGDNDSSTNSNDFILAYGDRSTALITNCSTMRLTGNRFACSVQNGFTAQNCYDLVINDNTFWRMNCNNKTGVTASALNLRNSNYCHIGGNSLGEQDPSSHISGLSNLDYAIHIEGKYNDWDVAQNIIGTNNYNHVNTAFIKDDFEGEYKYRNQILLPHTPPSTSVKTIEFEKWHDELINEDVYYEMDFDDDLAGDNISINDSNETIVVLYEKNNPYEKTITQSALPSTDPNSLGTPYGTGATKFEIEGHSKYQIEGQLAFWAVNEGDIRINIEYLKEDVDNPSTNIKKTFIGKYTIRDNTHSNAPIYTYNYTVPIKFDFLVEESTATYGAIRVRIYQNTDGNCDLKKDNNQSWLTIKKTGQIQYKN